MNNLEWKEVASTAFLGQIMQVWAEVVNAVPAGPEENARKIARYLRASDAILTEHFEEWEMRMALRLLTKATDLYPENEAVKAQYDKLMDIMILNAYVEEKIEERFLSGLEQRGFQVVRLQ